MTRAIFLAAAMAATGLGQSFLNMHGLGELSPAPEARAAALAGPPALSNANPGMLVRLPQTRISVNLLGSATLGTSGGRSRLVGNGRPAGFWAASPLPLGLRLSVAVNEQFNQDFDVWSESTAASPHRYHVTGRGGIYGLRGAVVKSLFGCVGLGLEYGRLLGGSREDWHFLTADGRYEATDTIEVDYSGSSLRAGASYQHRLFALAALFEPGLDLTARRYKRIHGTGADTARVYDLHLPPTLAAGAAVRPAAGLGINAGAEYRPWSGATFNDTTWNLRDVWRFSVGVEHELAEKHPLRVGYSRGDWYCRGRSSMLLFNYPITEQAFSAGTGFPIPRFGSLDVAAAVALRESDTDDGPLRETAFRLSLTLAYSEAWLRRTRRWGY